MSLRVLFTTPPSGKIIEPIYDKPRFVRPALATLSGYLRRYSDFEIRCIDAKFEKKNINRLVKEVINFSPDILGISSFTYEIKGAGKLAEAIKQRLPACNIIVGGSHVSAIPIETMREFPFFDIGVIGEAEETLLKIARTLLNKDKIQNVLGVVFRNDKNKIIFNPPKKEANFSFNVPRPAWDLLPPAREYFIQASRGCPFNCNFCFNPAGYKIRKRAVKDIIYEINFIINKFSPERISFGDEVFGADSDFTHQLLDTMIAQDIGNRVKWDIQTHPAFINDELLKKMKLAKVTKIEMGVESGSEKILERMGKGITKDLVVEAFKKVQGYKIKTGAFFILGHPNETKKTIWETIKFAAFLNPTEPIFAIMVPFPGTQVARYAEKKEMGYAGLSRNWEDYRKQINNSISFKDISLGKLKYYLVLGNIYVYLANRRFLDLVKFVFKYSDSAISFIKSCLLKRSIPI